MNTRRENIDIIIDELAWANRKRTELISDKHSPQALLDIFRDVITRRLVVMTDGEMPDSIESQKEFIKNEWKWFCEYYPENLKAGVYEH